MKASKFTDAQKAFIIRQGEEGTPVADLCRQAGISQATKKGLSSSGIWGPADAVGVLTALPVMTLAVSKRSNRYDTPK